ncbi:MAG: hypothetical protein QOG99_1858 [Frankiales bacterium]|jgi:hypothetical protein|nr:hypothetical protein [Frankiales bacterium]
MPDLDRAICDELDACLGRDDLDRLASPDTEWAAVRRDVAAGRVVVRGRPGRVVAVCR